MEQTTPVTEQKAQTPKRPAPKKKRPMPRPFYRDDKKEVTAAPSLTPDETAIFNRVLSEKDDWRDIDPLSMEDFSLSEDPFKLPSPALKEQDAKRFAFRWITRSPARLDQIRNKPVPFRWWICNSTNTPFLDEFIDKTLGCICREDQMLVFKPWWMRDKEQAYKRELADTKDRSGDLVAKDGQMKDGVELRAGKRSLNAGREMRQEVKGSDIVFGDAEELETDSGAFTADDGYYEQ